MGVVNTGVVDIQKIADSFRDGSAASVSLQIVRGEGASLFNGLSGKDNGPAVTNDGGFGSGPQI